MEMCIDSFEETYLHPSIEENIPKTVYNAFSKLIFSLDLIST